MSNQKQVHSDHIHSPNQSKETKLAKVLSVISGSFAPIIGVLAGAGLLKAMLSVLNTIGWLSKKVEPILFYQQQEMLFSLPSIVSRNIHST